MNKVVSYSFFRHDASHYEHPNCGEARGRVFLNYVRLIVRAHFAVWRGYGLVFHHDQRVKEFPYFRVLEKMAAAGMIRLVDMGKAITLCTAMMWRMRPIWEPGVDIVVCRDVDSVPLPRDCRAVEEFSYTSNVAMHVVHDASAHSGIMGGTLAAKASAFRAISGLDSFEAMLFDAYKTFPAERWNEHGCDQHYLNRVMLPKFRENLLLHELDHLTGDMGVPDHHIRRRIHGQSPEGTREDVAKLGDAFSKVIGGCSDVEGPYAFYDSLEVQEIKDIAKIEREALR